MKVFAVAALISAALAAPSEDVKKRQSCGPAFVWARGSGEPSPIGTIIGSPLQTALRRVLPNVKTYPVLYAASILTNVSPARTDEASMKKGVEAFEQAYNACPGGVIVAGGYSQGAAVMHNVVGSKLSAKVKARIAGVALFGDTRNQQDKGHIPNFPSERSKVWCNPGDGVCGGELLVNGAHMSYSSKSINEAAEYLAKMAKAFK